MGPTIISPANGAAWANKKLPPNSRIHCCHRIRSRRTTVSLAGYGKRVVILSYSVKENNWNQCDDLHHNQEVAWEDWRTGDEGEAEPQVLCGPPCQGKLVTAWRIRSVGGMCEASWEQLCYCYCGTLRHKHKGRADSSTVHIFFQNNSASLQVKCCLFWLVHM